MVYGEPRDVPLLYGPYPGSLPDVKTLDNILKKLRAFKVERTLFVLDKEFSSRANIGALVVAGMRFPPARAPAAPAAISTNRRVRRNENDWCRCCSRWSGS